MQAPGTPGALQRFPLSVVPFRPTTMVEDPARTRLYVANTFSNFVNSIAVYDTTGGPLVPIQNVALPPGAVNPRAMAINPYHYAKVNYI